MQQQWVSWAEHHFAVAASAWCTLFEAGRQLPPSAAAGRTLMHLLSLLRICTVTVHSMKYSGTRDFCRALSLYSQSGSLCHHWLCLHIGP